MHVEKDEESGLVMIFGANQNCDRSVFRTADETLNPKP